jgi:predicted nucleotidyltransferase component of viral defense system
MPNKQPAKLPHEDRQAFRDAVLFTAAETNFDVHLIEKDYFCSLVLRAVSHAMAQGLVFKGGTLLSKVYAGFNRLSEDLDFTMPLPSTTSRARRSAAAAPVKDAFSALSKTIPGLAVASPLKGSNNSLQYNGALEYESCLEDMRGRVSFEVGLREELLEDAADCAANTLVLDPIFKKPLLPPIQVWALSRREAYAEKFRAALTRQQLAIRDLFDVDHAIRQGLITLEDEALLRLVARKLGAGATPAARLSDEHKARLRAQVDTQLRSVLRPQNYQNFDFEQAWSHLQLAAKLVTKFIG